MKREERQQRAGFVLFLIGLTFVLMLIRLLEDSSGWLQRNSYSGSAIFFYVFTAVCICAFAMCCLIRKRFFRKSRTLRQEIEKASRNSEENDGSCV